ncbi:hypothetical protein RYX36_029181 [Vicia faba]
MTYYESKINSSLRTYYRIHLIAGGNKDNQLGGSIMNSIGKLSKHEVLIAEFQVLYLFILKFAFGAMVTMTYYESKINSSLRTYYRIHLIAGGNKDNLLGGSIMNSIGKSSKHEVLIAGGNKDNLLGGSIMNSIGKLSKHEVLIAGGNKDNLLGGSIMNSIGKLSKHEVLIAGGKKYNSEGSRRM